jgi:hypothetical protein
MFSFPSALSRLWGGALVLLNSIGTESMGTGLLFSSPDHLSSPQQVSIDYQGSFLTTGFAMSYPHPSGFFREIFVIGSDLLLQDECHVLIAPVISGPLKFGTGTRVKIQFVQLFAATLTNETTKFELKQLNVTILAPDGLILPSSPSVMPSVLGGVVLGFESWFCSNENQDLEWMGKLRLYLLVLLVLMDR